MLSKKNISYIAQVLFVLFTLISLKIIIDMFTTTPNLLSEAVLKKESIKKGFTSSNVIDSALSEKIVPKMFTYKDDIKSPFALLNGRHVTKRKTTSKVKAPLDRKKVFLKGILDKKNALALLEDDKGKTFICKIGDQVYNWTVSEISEQHVVIKDGSYEEVLKVKGR